MGLTADLAFGTEPVRVGDTIKDLDVCGLADQLYDAIEKVPTDLPALKETEAAGKLANEVFVATGFPALPTPAAAYKFAQDVMVRAVELKKAAGGAWRSLDAPASPEPTPDSTSAD